MIELYFIKLKNAKNYSQAFLKYLLEKKINIDENHLNICKNRYGKPYLTNYPNTHFNISHTTDAMICAISNNPVGVDIEGIRAFNDRIIKRFFTDKEQSYIFNMAENQNERFLEVWTKKEAYVKWLGKGIRISLQSFDVLNDKKIFTFKHKKYFVSLCSIDFTQLEVEGIVNFFELQQDFLLESI